LQVRLAAQVLVVLVEPTRLPVQLVLTVLTIAAAEAVVAVVIVLAATVVQVLSSLHIQILLRILRPSVLV
jgi:hypothetical protein